MDTEKIRQFLKSIEYIDLDGTFTGIINDLTPTHYSRFRFCPCCGYKNTDGHWQDCELAELLERLVI
jgi:hypothetical protein